MFLIEINGHFGTKNIQNDRYGAKMTVIETIWLIFTTYDDTGQWSSLVQCERSKRVKVNRRVKVDGLEPN